MSAVSWPSPDDLDWVLVFSGLSMAFMAWGIGANDVANSFGTAFGAQCLTIKQAVCIAAVCELAGAVFLGGHVSDTIRKGMMDIDLYKGDEGRVLIMAGMTAVLFGAACWLLLATKYSLPVSTTHSAVGGVIAFAISSKGYGSVNWQKIGMIVASWFISPAMSCLFSFILYSIIRFFVLRHEDSFRRAKIAAPLLIFCMTLIVALFTIYKGAKGIGLHKTDPGVAIGVSLMISAVAGLGSIPFVKWWSDKLARGDIKEVTADAAKEQDMDPAVLGVDVDCQDPQKPGDAKAAVELVEEPKRNTSKDSKDSAKPARQRSKDSAKNFPFDLVLNAEAKAAVEVEAAHEEVRARSKDSAKTFPFDLVKDTDAKAAVELEAGQKDGQATDAKAAVELEAGQKDGQAIWSETERIFQSFVVVIAGFQSLAHGANDVANSVGPFGAVLAASEGELQKKSEIPVWVFVMAGVMIVIGLAMYGRKVMTTIGQNITPVTPSKAACAQWAATCVVLVATRAGIPISTTHAAVGGVLGVGLADGVKNVNWWVMLKIFGSWVVTLPLTGIAAAGAYALFLPAVAPTAFPI